MSGRAHACVFRVCLCDPVSGHACVQGTIRASNASFPGHLGCTALLVNALFDTVGEGHGGSAEEALEGQDPDF